MNQADPSNHYCKRGNDYKFSKNRTRLLYLKRQRLLNPDEGFIRDDTIIIEASLKVFAKQSTWRLLCAPQLPFEADFSTNFGRHGKKGKKVGPKKLDV